MASPFDKHREEKAQPSAASLRAWCEETNAKKLMERMGKWYYVTRNEDGVEHIACLDGTDGENVRKVIAGTLKDFVGWSPKRMDGYRRWLSSCVKAGMVEREREPA